MDEWDFHSVIDDGYIRVKQYENVQLQKKVLMIVPVERLKQRALLQLRKEQNENPTGEQSEKLDESAKFEINVLQQLVEWFKNEFFRWFETPVCTRCQKEFEFEGQTRASGDICESFVCRSCNNIYLFPRHRNVEILLETRIGKCAEWSHVFSLMARAMGWRVRFVFDITDHVWTEVFSSVQGRWIHVDSCEGIIDQPLLYERGWGKELTYILAIGYDDLQDVTWRYCSDHEALLLRRNQSQESTILHTILNTRKQLQKNFTKPRWEYLQKCLIKELAELMLEPVAHGGTYSARLSGSKREELGTLGYIWKPNPDELSQKKVSIKYNSSTNSYSRICSPANEAINNWSSCVYHAKNMHLKHEKDWKMTYLARHDLESPGVITWKVDLTGTDHAVKKVVLHSPCFTLNQSCIKWVFKGESGRPPAMGENVEELHSNQLEDETIITISVSLEGGSSWQDTQIFRQKDDAVDLFFGFDIFLKPSQKYITHPVTEKASLNNMYFLKSNSKNNVEAD